MELVSTENRDRLRILFILYFFSSNITEQITITNVAKVFKSELRIQKIDFLIRYPDYLCYELVALAMEDNTVAKEDIKEIVKDIFDSQEPKLRHQEMTKYLYGAYEDIDNIISFLRARNLIKFKSKKRANGRTFDKEYYLTNYGLEVIENNFISNSLDNYSNAKWYVDRCKLIKKYFGDMSGTELKIRQYEHVEYASTSINEYIKNITVKVREYFEEIFGEEL